MSDADADTGGALGSHLLIGVARAVALNDYVFGRGLFDPAFPHHGTVRRCPYCDRPYRVHAGFSDHRDECSEHPIWGADAA